MLQKFCPIFPSRDIDRTEAFYARLGFRTIYRSEADDYLLLKREAAEVHFRLDPDHDSETCHHGGYMRPASVDEFSDEVAALGLPEDGRPCFRPPEDKPWRMRELEIVDPDGNLIRAAEELPLG